MRYPFSDNDEEFDWKHEVLLERTVRARIRTWWDSRRISSRERRKKADPCLAPLSAVSVLTPDDLPLIVVTHNEIALLPSFLIHYRNLGVTRFIVLDDNSSDGSRDFLLDQRDVDVWSSTLRFTQARRGRLWREALFQRYGINRWYVNVDADEFLIFDRYESYNLPALIRFLEKLGISRLPAPMLDMYSNDASGIVNNRPDQMPWTICRHFDATGYSVSLTPRGISVSGGPRARRFGERNELIKYPVIYWDEDCFFGSSIHKPTPYQRNFAGVWGALLHFKFFINYREKIIEAAENRQHFGNSLHYIAMATQIKESGRIDFHDDASNEFINSSQMTKEGYLSPIDDRLLSSD